MAIPFQLGAECGEWVGPPRHGNSPPAPLLPSFPDPGGLRVGGHELLQPAGCRRTDGETGDICTQSRHLDREREEVDFSNYISGLEE